MKILLVDDKLNFLEAIKSSLGDQGHDVDTAANGLAGYEQTHQNTYDLFIIDHLMPLMNGIQLIKRLRQQTKTQDTPIIFMSTQDINQLQYLQKAELIQHLISKPIDYTKLNNIVDSYQQQNTINLSL